MLRLWKLLTLTGAAWGSLALSAAAAEGISSGVSAVKTLKLAEGSIAYEDNLATGPAVLCIPGLGDTRGQFRLLAPLLAAQGYRVIVVDPRGAGDSDATFNAYSAGLVGQDVVKLLDVLRTPVYLVGNSSGGGSAAWAAAERPDKVKGVVFLDAFLRNHPMGFFNRLFLNLALRGPWAATSWIGYYKGLFITHIPRDQDDYTEALKANVKRSGRMKAIREMVFDTKADVTGRLEDVRAPVLAIMGGKDPDFKDPKAELDWIVSVLHGDKAVIDGAGHYPHLEYPEQVLKLVDAFTASH